MQTIFLDIDGVLNICDRRSTGGDIQPSCLKSLSALADRTGCHDAVLTSSWRKSFTETNEPAFAGEIRRQLESAGLRVAGITPVTADKTRAEEISYFVRRHGCGKYMVLDDDITLYGTDAGLPLYLTDSSTGLTDADVEKAYRFWKKYWR